MYKEITIDPSCMVEYSYYELIQEHFGFEKGRYLAISIKEWAREARPFVKNSNIPTIKKSSVMNFLNKIQKEKKHHEKVFLAYDRAKLKYQNEENWQSWVQRQVALRSFSAVLSEIKAKNYINRDDIRNNHNDWVIHPSEPVKKNAIDIIDTIESILPFSRHITILDNYFGLGKNNSQSTLHELFNRIKKYPFIKKVTLITNIKDINPYKTFKDEFESKHSSLPVFELIDDLPDSFFHDRYVFSEYMTINVGQGFSEDVSKGVAADYLNFRFISTTENEIIINSLKRAIEEVKCSIKTLNKIKL